MWLNIIMTRGGATLPDEGVLGTKNNCLNLEGLNPTQTKELKGLKPKGAITSYLNLSCNYFYFPTSLTKIRYYYYLHSLQ
jgi:hypothetical protein